MRKIIQGVFKKRGDGVGVSAQSRGEEWGGAYYKNLCSNGSLIRGELLIEGGRLIGEIR